MNTESQKIKLLMVDDEEDFLLPSSKALERRGFEVHMARDGTTALQMLKKISFDVILLDVKMPGMDGIDVFRKIKEGNARIPVIILTGHGSVSQAFQTSKEGITDYMAKPCDMAALADRLQRAVAESRDAKPNDSAAHDSGTDIIRVLLADDEQQLTESLSKALSRRNMVVTTVNSGESALDTLDSDLFDVVVLDIKMPGMDGISVLKKIKQRHPSVEVILLTGHPSTESALQGIKMGAREYLIKPPEVDDLADSIRKAYRSRQLNVDEEQAKLVDDIRRRYPE